MKNFDGKAAGVENIRKLWNLLASLVKKLTGDVDLTQGDLQTQISNNKTNIEKCLNGLSFGISANNCLTVTYDDGE